MIEYAEIMSPEKLSSFFNSLIKRSANNKSKAIELLNSKSQILINQYEEYKDKCVEDYYKQMKEYQETKEAWESKKCIVCNSNLRLINSFNSSFWGCSNYKDGRIHSTFQDNFDEILEYRISNCYVRVSSNWVTDIIRALQLPDFVKATDVLCFYEDLGYEDLRVKFGLKSSKERFGGYPKAKKISRVEEQEITKFLSPFFQKAVPQLGIKYKLVDKKESIAIIDLVLSNDASVHLVEIKRSPFDIDLPQLQLYKSLIAFILSKNGDKRKLIAVFLVYNTMPTYTSILPPFIFFDDIKHVKSVFPLEYSFEQKQIV